MSDLVPFSAFFYDPVTLKVSRIVRENLSPTDVEENVKRHYMSHGRPGDKVVFIPNHQVWNAAVILAQYGISS